MFSPQSHPAIHDVVRTPHARDARRPLDHATSPGRSNDRVDERAAAPSTRATFWSMLRSTLEATAGR